MVCSQMRMSPIILWTLTVFSLKLIWLDTYKVAQERNQIEYYYQILLLVSNTILCAFQFW